MVFLHFNDYGICSGQHTVPGRIICRLSKCTLVPRKIEEKFLALLYARVKQNFNVIDEIEWFKVIVQGLVKI